MQSASTTTTTVFIPVFNRTKNRKRYLLRQKILWIQEWHSRMAAKAAFKSSRR